MFNWSTGWKKSGTTSEAPYFFLHCTPEKFPACSGRVITNSLTVCGFLTSLNKNTCKSQGEQTSDSAGKSLKNSRQANGTFWCNRCAHSEAASYVSSSFILKIQPIDTREKDESSGVRLL